MNPYKIKNNVKDRKCSQCGTNYKRSCILEIDKNIFKCTKCILNASKKEIIQDPLSGSYKFTTGELSFNEYNNLLDSVELELGDLDDV